MSSTLRKSNNNLAGPGFLSPDAAYSEIVSYNNCQFKALSREQVSQYQKNFKKLNTNNDGFLDFFEVTQMLEKCGESKTTMEIRELIKEIDADQDGKISFPEFLVMMTGPPQVAGQPKKEISAMGRIAQSALGDKASFFEQSIAAQKSDLEDKKSQIKAQYEEKKAAAAIKKAEEERERMLRQEEEARKAESRQKLAARAAAFGN